MAIVLPLFGMRVTLTPLAWELMDIDLPNSNEGTTSKEGGSNVDTGLCGKIDRIATNKICARIIAAAADAGATTVLLEQQRGPSFVSPGNPTMFVMFHLVWHALACVAHMHAFTPVSVGAAASTLTCEAVQACAAFTREPYPKLITVNPTASQRSAYKKGLVTHVMDWIATCIPGPIANAYWDVGSKRDDMADAMTLLLTHVRLHLAKNVRRTDVPLETVMAGVDFGELHLSLAIARVRVERATPPPRAFSATLTLSGPMMSLLRKRSRTDAALDEVEVDGAPTECIDVDNVAKECTADDALGCRTATEEAFVVYLVWSKEASSTDIGFTSNLTTRMAQYAGVVPSGATRKARSTVDWELVCSMGPFPSAVAALQFITAWKTTRVTGKSPVPDTSNLRRISTDSRAVRARLNSLAFALSGAPHGCAVSVHPTT